MATCVGCGLNSDGAGLLSVERRPGGGLACQNTGASDDGLYLDLNTVSSTCIDVSGEGTTASPLTAAINLADSGSALACDGTGLRVVGSPDDCNALQVRGNGLYVPCQDGVAGTSVVQTSPQNGGLPQTVVDGGTYDYLNDNAFNSIHICNPTCCTVNGIVFVAVGGAYLNGHPGFIGGAHLDVNINNGGFGGVVPSTRQTLSVDSGNVQDGFLDINQNASFFLSLASNACADYQFRLRFQINTSPNANQSHIRTDGALQFVTRWVLTHTDCCDHVGP